MFISDGFLYRDEHGRLPGQGGLQTGSACVRSRCSSGAPSVQRYVGPANNVAMAVRRCSHRYSFTYNGNRTREPSLGYGIAYRQGSNLTFLLTGQLASEL